MRFSNRHHAVLTELTHETGCRSQNSHRNCGVRVQTQCHARPQTQRAVQCRTQLAAERASQAGTRCATRRPVDCQVEKGADVLTDSGAELPSIGAIDGRAEPRTRRAADQRAKSLIDGHIDGRILLGVEPRSHPGLTPLLPVEVPAWASGRAPQSLFTGLAQRMVRQQDPRGEKAATKHARRSFDCLPPPITPVWPPCSFRVLFAVSFFVLFIVFSDVFKRSSPVSSAASPALPNASSAAPTSTQTRRPSELPNLGLTQAEAGLHYAVNEAGLFPALTEMR